MADYRDMAAALSGGYGQDTGGITADTLITLKNGKTASAGDLLGMLKGYGQAVGSNLESLGRGGVASVIGAGGDLESFGRMGINKLYGAGGVNVSPTPVLPTSADILGMMPRATTPRQETAGMEELGGFMTPATAKVLKPAVMATGRMIGKEINAGLTGQPTRSLLGDITPKPLMAVEPQMQMAQAITKPKAEVSPLGFYSAVEQQALNIPRKQGTGESFLNELAKGQDVKKYEMETMGLDEFLKNKPNVTRQEVQDYIANNRINVQEKQLGGAITEDPIGIAQRKAVFDKYEPQIQALYKDIDSFGYNTPREVTQSTDNRLRALQEMRDAEANAYYKIPEPTPTKYDKYQLPGGENYREILLTTPSQGKAELDVAQIAAGDLKRQTADLMEQWKAASELNPGDPAVVSLYQKVSESRKLRDQAEATAQELKNQIEAQTYRSSHFDEPNILVHMRVNDRVDADGKKMLLIEEVQSDWHQAGREKGYQNKSGQYGEKVSPEEYKRGVALQNQQRNQSGPLTPSEQAELNDIMGRHEASIQGGRVPDAPFKDTWHQLALKRAIKEAVDKGYDRIGLTTGAQQAERYDLSKQINKIDYRRSSNNTFELGVVGKNGESVDLPKRFYTAEELPSVLGKEVADKIIKGEGQGGGGRMTLSGLDLQVGGEGMKKYYDEIYPNYLNKLGKKYGSQVGETNVKTQTGAPAFVDYIVGPGNFNDTTVLGLRSDGTTAIVNQNANSMEEAQQLANRYKEKHLGGGQEKVRYLDITPEMRKAIKEGQPLASIEEELAKALA